MENLISDIHQMKYASKYLSASTQDPHHPY